MAKKKETGAYEIDNLVRVTNREKAMNYIFATSVRMSPKIYEKYDCIKWQIKGTELPFVLNYLYPSVYYLGLECDGKVRKVKLRNQLNRKGEKYDLPFAYEMVLKKIPALRYLNEPKLEVED